MIIKKMIRIAGYGLAFLGIGATQSCSDDPSGELCYRCEWEDTYDGYTYDYRELFCFEDAKAYVPGITKDEFKELIEEFEDENDADCEKKELI